MKTVALVGFAETTRGAVVNSKADEIWTLNWGYNYKFIPRIDRLFEMHPIWAFQKSPKPEYIKPRLHWKWLHKPRAYPVYMLREFPDIPLCKAFPVQEVTEDLFGNKLMKGGDPTSFYSSSFDYMLALAIHEGFECIEIYGFEMGSVTEYRYQREGAALFIGLAMGRGIRVEIQPNSVLLRGRKYGYEGGQMIFRQDLERALHGVVKEKIEALALLQHLEGQVNHAVEIGSADVEDLTQKLQAARDDALIASASEQTLVYLIREIDLEEVELELVNPLQVIPTEA